jgi:hypothetical protein
MSWWPSLGTVLLQKLGVRARMPDQSMAGCSPLKANFA